MGGGGAAAEAGVPKQHVQKMCARTFVRSRGSMLAVITHKPPLDGRRGQACVPPPSGSFNDAVHENKNVIFKSITKGDR